MSLAKEVLSGSYAKVDLLLNEKRTAAADMLAEQEKRNQSGIPRPAWKEKYMKSEQAEKSPEE